MDDSGKVLNKVIMEVVDNQIRNNDPPATKETFDRLIASGIAKNEARRLIGCVVASEIFDIVKLGQAFNEKRYVNALNKLPELPE